MGGHGHGHAEPYKVPDYRIYKVEDVPLLQKTQTALKQQGLSDPWLRNEVWRYNTKHFGTTKQRIVELFGRGFKLGFGAFVVTMIATAAYDKAFPPKHGHGHDHH